MAMGLGLDAILENIFMVELEKAVVPTTVDVLLKWTCMKMKLFVL